MLKRKLEKLEAKQYPRESFELSPYLQKVAATIDKTDKPNYGDGTYLERLATAACGKSGEKQ